MPLPSYFFVKTTTIVGTPTDSVAGVANGRDPLGCALSNASYDHTGGASGERQLTAASGTPFSSVQAGDYIYLLNAVGGVADGLYSIASVPSSTVILLDADSGLTADSTADVDSSDGPWATLQYGFDTMSTTGDALVICDDGNGTGTDWEPAAALDLDTNTGGLQGLTYQGGTGRGIVDGTKATISGASLPATTNCITIGGGVDDLRFADLRITGATRWNLNGGTNAQAFVSLFRCRIDNAAGDGVRFEGDGWKFIDCEIDSNSGNGLHINTSNRGAGLVVMRCSVHDNTSSGLYGGGAHFTLIGSHFYDNGADGFQINRYLTGLVIDGCNFCLNTGDGVGFNSSVFGNSAVAFSNCNFTENGAYGVSFGSNNVCIAELRNCCFDNNTSGAIDTSGAGVVAYLGANSLPEHHPGTATNLADDPLFVSTTDGAEDFTPDTGSPVIDAGVEVPPS